jgi:hypothetical protein
MKTFTPLLASLALAAALVLALYGAPTEAQGPGPEKAPDTSKPFNHDTHLSAKRVGKDLECKSCHEMVAGDGTCPKQEVRFPKHEACTACHAQSFFVQPLTICANCHESAAFVAKNPLRELGRQVTPRKAEFSHKTHVTGRALDCTQCHEFVKGGVSVSHPSHPNCCQCHSTSTEKGKGVQPAMNQCGTCHVAGKGAGRPPSKIHSFSHKTHNTDPRTSASMACKQCHVNAGEAATLRGIRSPPMPVCVECHDGSDPNQPNPRNAQWRGTGAFHFSSCLKCHIAGSITVGSALPPSHPTTPAPPGAIK